MPEKTTISVEFDRHLLMKLLHKCHDHDLRKAVVAAQAGEPLSSLLFDEWSDHWPVIDAATDLTGDWVDSDSAGYVNYDDKAMICESEARVGGWKIEDGYATPPNEHEEEDDDA